MLKFQDIVRNPHAFTHKIELQQQTLIFRPLKASDEVLLTGFLKGLSPTTRRFSIFPSYDHQSAKEMCDAIAKYDKLRFVLTRSKPEIVGLLELSFFITQGDLERFQGYGIALNQEMDCRFGSTLADAYQAKGLGSLSFSLLVNVVRKFDRQRLILWGGVLADNARAIHFYQKHSFRLAGKFTYDEQEYLDMIADL